MQTNWTTTQNWQATANFLLSGSGLEIEASSLGTGGKCVYHYPSAKVKSVELVSRKQVFIQMISYRFVNRASSMT